MCKICKFLVEHKMTLGEAEDAARELTILEVHSIMANGTLEHTIALLESLEDTNLERLNNVIEEGLK